MIKQEVITELRARDTRHLIGIDIRLYDYAQSCSNDPDMHNLYELLAMLRFLDFFGKYDFRNTELYKFITFYEELEFSGPTGPERFRMTPVQVFQVASIFGFYREDGFRLTRDALLFVPRKFSKTTFVAAIAIYDLVFGDCNAQCYTAANSYKQAKVCMDMIKYILKRLDPRSKSFKRVKEIVESKIKGRDSKIECVSNSPDKLDGLMCSTVIVDEYSQADNADLYNVLTTSMGTRKNPLTVVITTASDKLDTPFITMLNNYQRILKGQLQNDRVFAHLFMPDEGDTDYGNPALWHKIHPHLGVTVYEDFYVSEWAKAQTNATDMKAFLTKLLNVFCNIGKAWLPKGVIDRATVHVDPRDFRGCFAMLTFDLSISDDFTVLDYTIYDRKERKFYSKKYYYIPRNTMLNHPNAPLYREMVAAGHMEIAGVDTIDFTVLLANVEEHCKILDIRQAGYDPYKSAEFVNTLAAMYGSKFLVPVKQTIAAFTAPTEIMEKGILDGAMFIDDNPLNAYCYNNVQMVEDSIGNRKPMKKSENSKIDGVITGIMGAYLFNNYSW